MVWQEDALRLALARAGHVPPPDDTRRQAAVAALVRRHASGEGEVLLMQRAERAGDPWSGHVSLPGGRREAGDADLVVTAIRESREELALRLDADARLVGALPTIPATARGRILPMSITPLVFVEQQPAAPALSAEAVGHFWFPLDAAARGELDGTLPYQADTSLLHLPCWRFQGHVIWGLTYRVLRSLLEETGRVGRPGSGAP